MQRLFSLVLLGVLLVSMSADAFILLMPTTPSALPTGAAACTAWVDKPNDNYGNLNIPTANTVWVNVGC
jgi:hypothetical protein